MVFGEIDCIMVLQLDPLGNGFVDVTQCLTFLRSGWVGLYLLEIFELMLGILHAEMHLGTRTPMGKNVVALTIPGLVA